MRIKLAIIISIVLFFTMMVLNEIAHSYVSERILPCLWLLSLLWVIYEIIAQIVRSIYKAIKNRKASQSKTPLEP